MASLIFRIVVRYVMFASVLQSAPCRAQAGILEPTDSFTGPSNGCEFVHQNEPLFQLPSQVARFYPTTENTEISIWFETFQKKIAHSFRLLKPKNTASTYFLVSSDGTILSICYAADVSESDRLLIKNALVGTESPPNLPPFVVGRRLRVEFKLSSPELALDYHVPATDKTFFDQLQTGR